MPAIMMAYFGLTSKRSFTKLTQAGKRPFTISRFAIQPRKGKDAIGKDRH
jgi:hypothetical protein